jgi:hypothetical protein
MGSERVLSLVVAIASTSACASAERRFPLRNPIWRDGDMQPVYARCHEAPQPDDPDHVSCAPEPYDAPIYWDGADNMLFRPLSQALGIVTSGEAANVNSLDEVPDSSWFTNRLGMHPMSVDDLRLNACRNDQLLDPEHAPDHSWLIDKGKTSGSTPGFRMTVPGHGHYLVKLEATPGSAERQVAATVIGEAVYYAAGYNATCEQALLVRPSTFKLAPGLKARHGNFGDLYDFDQKALDDLFAHANKHGGLLRISASAWLPGYVLENFQYSGTRSDDPNDIIPHEDRRELRAARVLASWIDDFDERQGNSLAAWISDAKGSPPDSSPGHVVHYQSGTSAALGSVWSWDAVSRGLGYEYVVDWGDMSTNFITLGAATRSWESMHKAAGHEEFGYMDVAHFDPEHWKNEYPNPAFDRMTERDAAWMARILARFTPATVHELVAMARFADPANADYLEGVLEGRLSKILERYLTRLSSIADVHLEGPTRLCATDLAEWRRLRDATRFRYAARLVGGPWLVVDRRPGGQLCVNLPHVPVDGEAADAALQRYVKVRLEDGVSRGPLVAHLYDLGPARGYFLAGLERPER